jgi:hypothetical protein
MISQGFTVICNVCETQSELYDGNDRMEEKARIFVHDLTIIRINCSKCGHDIILK